MADDYKLSNPAVSEPGATSVRSIFTPTELNANPALKTFGCVFPGCSSVFRRKWCLARHVDHTHNKRDREEEEEKTDEPDNVKIARLETELEDSQNEIEILHGAISEFDGGNEEETKK